MISKDSPPTKRQRVVLRAIRSLTQEHGMPPTLRELAERLGSSSHNAAECHVRALEARGLISRLRLPSGQAVPRGVRLTRSAAPWL